MRISQHTHGDYFITRIVLLMFIIISATINGYSQTKMDTAAVVVNNRQLYSVVISQNDKIIYEHYFNGKNPNDLFNNQSLTKSVVSLLIGIAIDKGYIKSVDEPIADFFPQLKQDTDRRKANITIRMVMNQASGLWHEDLANLHQFFALDNPSGYVLQMPLVSEPGKTFHYNNAASHILSVIITKSTGISTYKFADKYLFGPLGIKNTMWGRMNDGYYDGCGLLSVQMTAVEMNKIGLLVLHGGYFNHKGIVSAKWIAEIFHPNVTYNTPWGFTGSTYGLCWYRYTYHGTPITYGLGWGGQYVFVIPGKKAVINVNESIDDTTAIKASNLFLYKLFPLIFERLK